MVVAPPGALVDEPLGVRGVGGRRGAQEGQLGQVLSVSGGGQGQGVAGGAACEQQQARV